MTETVHMPVQQKTVSLAEVAAPPTERDAASTYQLHNDTKQHVTVFRQEWNVPKSVFVLAPGATSDPYPAGYEIYILYAESGQSTPLTWDGWDKITYYYNLSGYTGNGVNNVSAF